MTDPLSVRLIESRRPTAPPDVWDYTGDEVCDFLDRHDGEFYTWQTCMGAGIRRTDKPCPYGDEGHEILSRWVDAT